MLFSPISVKVPAKGIRIERPHRLSLGATGVDAQKFPCTTSFHSLWCVVKRMEIFERVTRYRNDSGIGCFAVGYGAACAFKTVSPG